MSFDMSHSKNKVNKVNTEKTWYNLHINIYDITKTFFSQKFYIHDDQIKYIITDNTK